MDFILGGLLSPCQSLQILFFSEFENPLDAVEVDLEVLEEIVAEKA
jgi:hypothetical protein